MDKAMTRYHSTEVSRIQNEDLGLKPCATPNRTDCVVDSWPQ